MRRAGLLIRNLLLLVEVGGLVFVLGVALPDPEGRRAGALRPDSPPDWLPHGAAPPEPAPGTAASPSIPAGAEDLTGTTAARASASAGTVDEDRGGEAAVPISAAPPEPPPAAPEAPAEVPAEVPAPLPPHVITRVQIPQIGVDSEVIVARVVAVRGGRTWEVPAFRVGHGEYTAGAGQPGNAVLFGHLTSLDAGNVFRDLHRMRPGNLVRLFNGERAFDYRVVDVRAYSRTDLSPLYPTETPTVSLITCTGVWLPALQDFSARLVVRAELLPP
jgi:LPXTG-site transpeptidase (sortase) family protein